MERLQALLAAVCEGSCWCGAESALWVEIQKTTLLEKQYGLGAKRGYIARREPSNQARSRHLEMPRGLTRLANKNKIDFLCIQFLLSANVQIFLFFYFNRNNGCIGQLQRWQRWQRWQRSEIQGFLFFCI